MIASAVAGSAAMPFIFPPMNMSKFGLDQLLMDGGTTWNNNMVSGVEECMKIPGIVNYSQIEIDVMVLTPAKMENFNESESADTPVGPLQFDLEPMTFKYIYVEKA